jgi:hypothetical protein
VPVESVTPVAEVHYPRVRDEAAKQAPPWETGRLEPGVVHLAAVQQQAIASAAAQQLTEPADRLRREPRWVVQLDQHGDAVTCGKIRDCQRMPLRAAGDGASDYPHAPRAKLAGHLGQACHLDTCLPPAGIPWRGEVA